MLSAERFESQVEKAKEKKPTKEDLGKFSAPTLKEGIDFAIFITFAIADAGADEGVFVTDAQEAITTLMSGNLPQLSRILIVTLGGDTTFVDRPCVASEQKVQLRISKKFYCPNEISSPLLQFPLLWAFEKEKVFDDFFAAVFMEIISYFTADKFERKRGF